MIRMLAVFALLTLTFLVPAADDPPKALKPIPLPFNTAKDEDDPHISSDELSFFYTVVGKDKAEVFISQRKKAKEEWGAGKAVVDLKTKTANNRGVFLTPDGKFPQYLFYATDEDFEKKGQKGDNFDIYFLIKQNAAADWTTKTAIVTIGTEADETHPWLSADNRHLFFSRKDKEGWHVYQVSRPGVAGQFGEAMKLDFPPDFHHATLTPDLKTMVLQGPIAAKGDKKRFGLYLSTNANGKGWTKPEELKALNHAEGPIGDVSPNLSRDGLNLYFASDRPGGKGGLDIYTIPTAQLVKKKEK
ncbi:MAG: hypothetical protein K2R98_33155 [Gemmataceae bacterium]|nr:hypothetical protein [Gemmataceae bacterium]